jgi:hypothetical protein
MRASFLSIRACWSRKYGAIVAIAHAISCCVTSARSDRNLQPTMVPWQEMTCFGHTLLMWVLRSSRSRTASQRAHDVVRLRQRFRWCSWQTF